MTSQSQRGGTFLGLIIGLVLGLGLALAVAVYVTKVPTPFTNKNQSRTSAQDVQEAEKNKDWNPNVVLQPKLPAAPPAQPETPEEPVSADGAPPRPIQPSASGPSESTPAVSADPLGDWVKAQSGQGNSALPAQASDTFVYWVQTGAYSKRSDAEALRAKLALLGMEAAVSERDQAGRVVYRVRSGPFSIQKDAERLRMQLQANDIENTLVRVQR